MECGRSYGRIERTLGAFGAHGLKSHLGPTAEPARVQNWQTAAHYQLLHSVLILVNSAATASSAKSSNRAAMWLTMGNLMFSGSIYALTLLPTGHVLRRVLGPVTPLGGLCYVAGWISMLFLDNSHTKTS